MILTVEPSCPPIIYEKFLIGVCPANGTVDGLEILFMVLTDLSILTALLFWHFIILLNILLIIY